VVLGVVAAVAWPPRRADACKCRSPEPREALAAADVVFVGRADRATTSPGEETFAVERVWKGKVPAAVKVDNSAGSCKFIFEEGARYLVFARGAADALELDACGGTRHIDHAGEWLAALGPGSASAAPVSGTASAEAPKVARPSGCAIVRDDGRGLGWLLLALAWRRRIRACAPRR